MHRYLIIAGLLLLPVPAHADCTVNFNPGGPVINPQGQPNFTLNGCGNQGDVINITRVNSFDARFTDIQNQINSNRSEARAGIAMAMAAASMGVSGAAAAAGAGKLAVGAGFGEFEGTVSLSAGVAYALSKQFNLNAGVSIAPLNGRPMLGISGGATLVLN